MPSRVAGVAAPEPRQPHRPYDSRKHPARAGEDDEALQHYREALRLKPMPSRAAIWRRHWPHRRLPAAVTGCAKPFESSRSARAARQSRRVLLRLQRTEEAIAEYEQAAKLAPDSLNCSTSSPRLTKGGRLADAIRSLEAARSAAERSETARQLTTSREDCRSARGTATAVEAAARLASAGGSAPTPVQQLGERLIDLRELAGASVKSAAPMNPSTCAALRAPTMAVSRQGAAASRQWPPRPAIGRAAPDVPEPFDQLQIARQLRLLKVPVLRLPPIVLRHRRDPLARHRAAEQPRHIGEYASTPMLCRLQ